MLDDWEDLIPGAIVIAEDVPPVGAYSPAIVGPDAAPSTGEMPNAIKGRLRVGVTGDYIVLDPDSPLRMAMYAANVEQLRVGNLNGFLGYTADLYGIAVGGGVDYLKYAGGSLQISGAIEGGTIDIGGSDVSSFHIDSGGNLWLGAAAFNIATNPFAVSAAGMLRAASGVIAGFNIDPTGGLYAGLGSSRVQMKPGEGFWAGDTVFGSAPFRVGADGALVASSAVIAGQMTGEVNATSGYSTNGYFYNMTLGKTGVVSGILTLQLADGMGDTYIASGKTDFTNVETGFILGIDDSDANTPKFYIGSPTKHFSWDGTNLESTGMTLIDVVITGTVADSLVINSDLGDVNADLVLGRTTGGNATLRWDGAVASVDKTFAALVGLHVGGASDPGDNNLLVDGTGIITGNAFALAGLHVGGSSDPGNDNLLVDGTGKVVGAFGCNGATVQTAAASGGSLGIGVRTNLYSRSETFSDFINNFVTLSSGATSPTGEATAQTMTLGSGTHSFYSYAEITLAAGPHTLSIYAKAGTIGWIGVGFGGYTTADGAFFDLVNGVIGTVAAGSSAQMRNVGGGWYRCSVTRTLSAGVNYIEIEPHQADNHNTTYTAAGTETISIYGQHMEFGSSILSYIPTTVAPYTLTDVDLSYSRLYKLVGSIRSALVANGIMS
jgi:hypothetical protein